MFSLLWSTEATLVGGHVLQDTWGCYAVLIARNTEQTGPG